MSILKIDGSWRRGSNSLEMKSGIGWALFDGGARRKWGSKVVQAADPTQVEIMALWRSTQTDSLALVKSLQKKNNVAINHLGLVHDIIDFVNNCFEFVKVTKVPRIEIQVVHDLARDCTK